MERRAILYSAGEGASTWVTDVQVRENGDVAFCSGDGRRERYLIVTAAELPQLRRSVLNGLGSKGSTTPDDLLDLLKRLFSSGTTNPLSKIEMFLEENAVAWREDNW